MSSYRPRHAATPPVIDEGRRSVLRRGVMGAAGAAALTVAGAAIPVAASAAGGIRGQDVSGWQGTVDWASQISRGSRFAWIKATEGRSYRDGSFNTNYIGATNAGIIRGGYHFARPDSGGPEEQVDFFLAHGGSWTADGITLPGMVDFEAYGSLPRDYGLSRQEMREWISTFLVRYRDLVGRRPVVYTNAHWWDDVVGDWTPTNTPLVLAAYQSTAPTNLPGNWWAWDLWQYSDAGPFAGDSILWHGDEAQFESFVSSADYDAHGI
ncbi:GH25 family lysozyme [Brachybacterium sp. DNPG3]